MKFLRFKNTLRNCLLEFVFSTVAIHVIMRATALVLGRCLYIFLRSWLDVYFRLFSIYVVFFLVTFFQCCFYVSFFDAPGLSIFCEFADFENIFLFKMWIETQLHFWVKCFTMEFHFTMMNFCKILFSLFVQWVSANLIFDAIFVIIEENSDFCLCDISIVWFSGCRWN